MEFELGNVVSRPAGFCRINDLASRVASLTNDDIILDMKSTTWLEANMCAPLGAILYMANKRDNTITLRGLHHDVEDVLAKNGFMQEFGIAKAPDINRTTIEYKRFRPSHDTYFADYLEDQLRGKGIPQMTPALAKEFRRSIHEIFGNAVHHAQTSSIFACGQFFPRKNRLDFSITDLGIGFRESILRKNGIDFTAEKAIEWAMEGKNTSRTGSVPGGIGLKLIREFIELNDGRIHIMSDAGYWEYSDGKVEVRRLDHSFPGTVVNIEINTADTKSYHLSTEKNAFP